MVRIGISVEGLTEERFIKGILVAYFLPMDIYVQPVSMSGNVSVDRAKHEIERLVYSFDYVTTFYDFYGFKKKQSGETKDSLERKIKNALKENVRDKIIPYIQMHEFEGLLFSSPEAIASVLKDPRLVRWGEQILEKFKHSPEMINDSPQSAPSKRLEQDTSYRKTTHGPNIAKEIGLKKMREMCLGFDSWLTRIGGLIE
jgi:hypothetical protein